MRLNKCGVGFYKNPTLGKRKEKEEKRQQIPCDKKGLCYVNKWKFLGKLFCREYSDTMNCLHLVVLFGSLFFSILEQPYFL